MSYKFEEGKDLIIDAVVERLKEKMEGEQASLCAEFVRQFYGTVALEDLREWDIEDLYGAAVNFWSLIQQREPDETKIRIYNPDFERHGWQTTHTVVEIITEDMPFLVDSLRMVINRLGLVSHLIMHMGGLRLQRNKNNQVTAIYPRKKEGDVDVDGVLTEAAIFIEIDRQTDPSILEDLHNNFERVLEDNRVVVKDWLAMRKKVREAIAELDQVSSVLDPAEVEETKAFLNWIEDHHFTFLGVRDYELVQRGQETILQPLPNTGLGVLRQSMSKSSARSISAMTPEAREHTLSSRILVMSKTNTEATVHRRAYTDYIGIKRFNKKGQVIGERRIIGLYTSAAYNTNPKHIPFLRHKVALIMKNSNLNPRGHAGKVLLNILETLPRDDLIQGSEDELLEIAMGIYYMQERRRIRMFARVDVYRRFVSCLVYVPKERFNTELRQEMQKVLAESFNSHEITFSTWFSESVLARIHFMIRTNPQDTTQWDFKEIEQRLIEIGRTWTDDLQHFLFETFGEENANRLYSRYKHAFPVAYSANFSPRTAVYDVKHIETLSPTNPLVMNFYKLMDEKTENFRLKIYQHDSTIPLSDVLPIVERLGMRAISERPYQLKFEDGRETWINDFALQYTRGTQFEIDDIKDLFQNAFASVWFGEAENDGFNQLVLGAELDWRQVAVLRTYAKYFKQIGFTFSQEYIESALNNNTSIAKKLVALFETRFNPTFENNREEECSKIANEIFMALDDVANLDEDKIIRQYVQIIQSTLRTNYYQIDKKGNNKSYISVKLNSKEIPGVPKPYPMFEIFVYSPKVEGVHLRGGRVARGGLRWSDRREDFRTEILGLMKAQQVKNAVIVPSGAKGGFVPKQLPVSGTREEILAEGIRCYKLFIRGLLDITDNYNHGTVVRPVNAVCYDEDDPYLVVAADKGTATFSDIANEISLEYGFWLGDAFASGGSVGYDHKKMGITARGAWESVKRHFYEMNRDIQTSDFTVVGIGDMAGDVFGNGMLLSRHIKLLGAFNHMHIFVDPDPDPETSFKERERLFNLPRSTWVDYDKKLISKGGGVFNRSAKSITVSKEMKEVFDIKQASIEPNELIRLLLRAKVDLLWSAGIGTFVKAQTESHSDVGDRTNDVIRINAKQLRCKVVGEGGNLGLTQLARVEYALNGGLIFTDFIDNSAGVNCSDKEVNIKILLDGIVAAGDLTDKQRNELLSEMTDEVAALVLRDNFAQPRAISLAAMQSAQSVELHSRYINELERSGKLDRELEFLPNEKVLMERKLMGKGLTRPGIAVLLCYTKTILKEQILASNVPEDSFLKGILVGCFPKPLQERFSNQIQNHPLKREIIATRLSNLIVNEMGFTFVYRLQDETGAPVSAIVRAYMIARSVLDLETIWNEIAALGTTITAEKQNELMMLYLRLLRRVTRWFLRSQRMGLNISKAVKHYGPGVKEFKKAFPQVLGESNRAQYDKHFDEYIELGIPKKLAHELTLTRALFSALDVIEVSHHTGIGVAKVAEIYFGIGEFLNLAWIRTQVISHPTETHWESLSREALRDDLDWQQRQLTAGIINFSDREKDFMHSLALWSENHLSLIDRWRHVLADLRSSPTLNYTMFFVAIRELLDLTQTTIQMSTKEVA
ncbi:NAD-glutamate dehydrogenase [Legionella clemsonensis]|uniref:NAD-specific glutamate dehydrogenase n=1 Tax=Legionella clemsonensis TaxID=1867846 RepID=A0A222P2A2_9GAMM|nr:NAD-glutamate dehydrogenase [Legionella clemsonensis]ASQ45978.1 NAD-specific glutamate dehydrogenase [Legionella clemsonensis]